VGEGSFSGDLELIEITDRVGEGSFSGDLELIEITDRMDSRDSHGNRTDRIGLGRLGGDMTIKLKQEVSDQLIASIKRYFEEQLDQTIGDLKAKLLLEFCLGEIGPCVYNQAIADAQTYVQGSIAEIDSTCFEPEFGYWREP